jgi:hypothetical protein
MTFERWIILCQAVMIAGLLIWHHFQVKMIITGTLANSGSEFQAALRRPRTTPPAGNAKPESLT